MPSLRKPDPETVNPSGEPVRRLHIQVRGIVQGVGFRPFVYKLAKSLDLTGYVFNSSSGVTIEIEGGQSKVDGFLKTLRNDPPQLAEITQIITASLIESDGSAVLPLRASRAYAAPRDRRERTERKAPNAKSQPCFQFNYATCARSTDGCKFGHFCMGCKAVHPVSGCQLPASVQVMARHKDPKVKEEKKTRS